MHFGSGNPRNTYTMIDKRSRTTHQLTVTESERDLGIMISSDAKWHVHANTIAAKANSILGWMKNSFMCRSEHLWKKLCTTYIRSHLEYAAPVWNVYNKSDIVTIKRVQRRATKVPHSLKQFDYNERLARMGITQLTERRCRGTAFSSTKSKTN